MKDKGHAVTAHLHVTFHAMPRPDCSVKGRAAVFYHPVTVQATMREGLRSQKGDAPGIGRRRKEAVKPGEPRSEERRVGQECGSQFRYRWWANHEKKKRI